MNRKLPCECYFHVKSFPRLKGYSKVFITDIEHFEKTKFLNSQINIQTVTLPRNFHANQEAIFSTEQSVKDTKEMLKKLGYQESKEFSTFCKAI